MPNEPIQGLPYPALTGAPPNVPSDIKALADAVVGRTVMRFASVAARDAALPSPVDGMVCFVAADTAYYVRAGGQWRVLWQDTGWVAGTLDGDLAGTIEYRRVGRTVYVRWYISTSMNAGQLWAPAFTAPADFRPSSAFAQGVAASAYGNSAYPITARILPNGQCQMRNNHTAAVTNSNGYAVYATD